MYERAGVCALYEYTGLLLMNTRKHSLVNSPLYDTVMVAAVSIQEIGH